MDPLQPALNVAASSDQIAIVSYLLDQVLDCDREAVKATISGVSTDILQAFLDHNLIINSSIGLNGGPALTKRFPFPRSSMLLLISSKTYETAFNRMLKNERIPNLYGKC
jgi:hypothetical protein